MSQQPVRPTRAMNSVTFAKHINSRHLEADNGEIYPGHFFIYGLETLWRGYHLNDHKKNQEELDHYHTEGTP